MSENKSEKGVFAPRYYEAFCCLADKCRHSCCVAWEICIDKATYAKYKKAKDIFPTVVHGEDGSCFALREDGRCPHLTESGLCRIILTRGEGYLSQICRDHPRFFNHVGNGRVEAGIGIACGEACRLVLESDEPYVLIKTSACDEAFGRDCLYGNAAIARDRILAFLREEGGFEEKIIALKESFGIPEFCASEWYDRFCALEILDLSWEQSLQAERETFLARTKQAASAYDAYYVRLLRYFVYRHVIAASSERNLRARLAFCLLSVEVIRSLFEADLTDEQKEEGVPAKLLDWARRYSAEIEYSDDNTDELIFAFESKLYRLN